MNLTNFPLLKKQGKTTGLAILSTLVAIIYYIVSEVLKELIK